MIKLFNKDCLEIMPSLPNNSIDIILTDPPYLYLKGQKLEREFDEQKFFSECKRILAPKGFIVLFGRGTSFYRWNTILADLGFDFKEEIVWDKSYNSSPVTPINRVHETIAIYSIGGAIQQSFIPYCEIKTDFDSIRSDVKRIKSALNNKVEFEDLLKYIEFGKIDYKPENRTLGNNTTVQTAMSQQSRPVKTMQSITRGLKEKSIIKQPRDHRFTIHPTQKPVRLIERLLALTLPKDKERKDVIVADFFGGSFSTMEACYNMGLQGISCEIDKEYFDKGKERIEKLKPIQQELFNEAI